MSVGRFNFGAQGSLLDSKVSDSGKNDWFISGSKRLAASALPIPAGTNRLTIAGSPLKMPMS
jgi:hypothetical protein